MSGDPPTGLVVVARRWDGLGGRLNAMVNAAAIAEAHHLPFRFIWPRGGDDATGDPTLLFDQEYLAEFELQPADLDGLTRLGVEVLADGAFRDIASVDGPPDTGSFIDVTDPFDIVDAGDTRGASQQRFRHCFDRLGWTEEVRQLMQQVGQRCSGAGLSAIHIRAGDIVTGGWRHMMQHDKYSPTPFVVEALERLTADGAPVVIVSDNDDYVAWLRDRFPSTLTSADLVAGYRDLAEAHRTLADVLVMSQCHPLVGGPRSAFSLLAAHLGGGRVVRPDSLLTAGQEETVLLDGIEKVRRDSDRTPFLRGLMARDICWYLDVFGDTLPIEVQLTHARRAAALDDFGGAFASLSRVESLAGDTRGTRTAARRATQIAQSLTVHADPLVEALAGEITAQVLGALTRLHRTIRTGSPGDLAVWRRRLVEDSLTEMRHHVGRCRTLTPYQLQHHEILDLLRQLMTAMEWLSGADDAVLVRVGAGVGDGRHDHVDLSSFRPSGLEQHRGEYTYDPVIRHVERVALCVSHVLGSALAGGPPSGGDGAAGHVDRLWQSASGIWWMEGWALPSTAGQPCLVAAFAPDSHPPLAETSPTFVMRADVNAAYNTASDDCHGFRIPVPLDLAMRAVDVTTVCVVSPAGTLSPIP